MERPRPHRWQTRTAAAVACLLLGLAACRRGPGPVHVVTVDVSEGALAEPLREAGIDAAALQAAAREGLAGAGFRLGEGGRPHRARLDVVGIRFAPAFGDAPARVELAVELELSPADGGAGHTVRESGAGSASLAGGRPAVAWRSALGAASRRAADGLTLAFTAADKPVSKLIADLDDRDPRQRARAVQALADRRAPEAVPALIQRLHDPDSEVAHLAVGALAQTRDPRAVGPLIDLSRQGEDELTARLARIIGDIGGAEAEGYLLTLESGHPDPQVRRAAREAIQELRARAHDGGPVAGK